MFIEKIKNFYVKSLSNDQTITTPEFLLQDDPQVVYKTIQVSSVDVSAGGSIGFNGQDDIIYISTNANTLLLNGTVPRPMTTGGYSVFDTSEPAIEFAKNNYRIEFQNTLSHGVFTVPAKLRKVDIDAPGVNVQISDNDSLNWSRPEMTISISGDMASISPNADSYVVIESMLFNNNAIFNNDNSIKSYFLPVAGHACLPDYRSFYPSFNYDDTNILETYNYFRFVNTHATLTDNELALVESKDICRRLTDDVINTDTETMPEKGTLESYSNYVKRALSRNFWFEYRYDTTKTDRFTNPQNYNMYADLTGNTHFNHGQGVHWLNFERTVQITPGYYSKESLVEEINKQLFLVEEFNLPVWGVSNAAFNYLQAPTSPTTEFLPDNVRTRELLFLLGSDAFNSNYSFIDSDFEMLYLVKTIYAELSEGRIVFRSGGLVKYAEIAYLPPGFVKKPFNNAVDLISQKQLIYINEGIKFFMSTAPTNARAEEIYTNGDDQIKVKGKLQDGKNPIRRYVRQVAEILFVFLNRPTNPMKGSDVFVYCDGPLLSISGPLMIKLSGNLSLDMVLSSSYQTNVVVGDDDIFSEGITDLDGVLIHHPNISYTAFPSNYAPYSCGVTSEVIQPPNEPKYGIGTLTNRYKATTNGVYAQFVDQLLPTIPNVVFNSNGKFLLKYLTKQYLISETFYDLFTLRADNENDPLLGFNTAELSGGTITADKFRKVKFTVNVSPVTTSSISLTNGSIQAFEHFKSYANTSTARRGMSFNGVLNLQTSARDILVRLNENLNPSRTSTNVSYAAIIRGDKVVNSTPIIITDGININNFRISLCEFGGDLIKVPVYLDSMDFRIVEYINPRYFPKYQTLQSKYEENILTEIIGIKRRLL